jgi:hypothetical protein
MQNGFILNFTFTAFLIGSRVTDSMHFSTKALFSAKELWVNNLEPLCGLVFMDENLTAKKFKEILAG